jgi:hypothetical protein
MRLIASSMMKEITSMMRGDRRGAGVVELLQPITISSGAISETIGHVAGDEDHRAVLADAAREGERETGEHRGAAAAG